jgi:hypothetical protein
MKAYLAAMLIVFGFYFIVLVAQAAPILDCPVMCNSNENCSCTVKGCSDGFINLQNRIGQPINMTSFLLSGDFPVSFFSTDNYRTSFKASREGAVGVKLVCFDSESAGKVEKTIVISLSQNTSQKIQNPEDIQSKLMAQIAIHDLEAAINNVTEGELIDAQDLLNKAKAALVSADYANAQKYANEGYGLINPSQNATDMITSSSGNSLIDTITSIDPLYLGIAAAAMAVAILAILYLRKKRRRQQSASGIRLGDLVKE